MKTFNKRLEALVDDSAIRIHGIRTKEEVLALVRAFRKFERKGRVGFDHGYLYGMSFLLLGFSLLLWLASWAWPGANEKLTTFELVVLLLLNAAVVSAPLFLASDKSGRLTDLSNQLARKWLWLDRALQEKTHIASALWARWFLSFGEFSQGDEKPDLTACVGGFHHGPEHQFEYIYYTFEFTVVRGVDKNHPAASDLDAAAIRTVEKRYGIVCDFPYARGIAIVGGGGEFKYPARWKTSSRSFNAKFAVHAESEQAAARFLKPAVVLAIEAAASAFPKMNVEINREGKLCLSFDKDLLQIARNSSLVHPGSFEFRLRNEKQAPGLTQALELIHTLLKYSDNNFERE